MDTKAPLEGGDSKEFMSLMDDALKKINMVDNATSRANKSLNNYADSFNVLNKKLERYISLSSDIKGNKFNRITIDSKESTSRKTSTTSSVNQADDYIAESKRITDTTMNTVFRSIDSLMGSYGRVLTTNVKKITSSIADVKSLNNGVKAAKNVEKANKLAGAAAGQSAKSITGMSTAALSASAVIAGVAIVLGSMAAAGKYAYERNMEVNRSLMMMGDTANELTSSSSKTANQMIGIKDTWTRIGEDLANVFEPVFTLVIDFVDTISKAIEKFTSPLGENEYKRFTSSDSKARWYTNELEKNSGIPESKSLPVIGNIASTAKQSGFDNVSAANLAIGTYDIAIKKAQQYGVEAGDVAKKLADAWTNGSDAAKEYGVVVDDQTLIGYMASRGVDIVNVQISDAMKQYYRYGLMQEELKADSNDAMQKQIKHWKQLGMQIDATKQKLFSFDEVIQLSAVDPTIPNVGVPGVGGTVTDKSDKVNVAGTVPNMTIGNGGNGLPVANREPVEVPVVYSAENEWVLNPNPSPINIPVYIPGLELVGELVYELGLLWGMMPLPVNVPVVIPGMDSIPLLEDMLESLKGLTPVPVSVPVDVPGFELAPQLLTYCTQLSTSPFISTVLFTIPGLALAPTLLEYLYELAHSWEAKVNISVAGLNLLQQAQSLLNRVISLVSMAGQAVATATSNAYNAVKSGVSRSYSAAREYVTGGSNSWASAVKLEGYSARDINTAKGMANKNGANWESLSSYQKTQYVKVADVVNRNIMVTKSDGIEMLNSYNKTGQATSSKANWMNTTGTDIANTSLKGAAVMGGAGATLLTGGLVAPLVKGAGSTVGSWLSGLSGATAAFGMATGGIGTKETTIRAFEGNKKEAVIPLETQAGVDYLANAMKQAGANENQSAGGTVQVYLTLSGVNIADNDAQWQKVGEKIGEVIDIQRQRRGDLNYGSTF